MSKDITLHSIKEWHVWYNQLKSQCEYHNVWDNICKKDRKDWLAKPPAPTSTASQQKWELYRDQQEGRREIMEWMADHVSPLLHEHLMDVQDAGPEYWLDELMARLDIHDTASEDALPTPYIYQFPTHRLRAQQHSSKTPLVLIVCGSFSPITIMHLRMCEMASDWVRMAEDSYEVVGIYLSPVSDAYKKTNLAAAHHRIRMCELAVEDMSDTSNVMVDSWEATQPRYVPTAQVLDHFRHEINDKLGGIVSAATGECKKAHIALLCGADLMQSMSTPGLWSPDDLDRILGGDGGLYVVERHGTDLEEAKEALSRWTDQISVIPQCVPIDLSSTKVRLFLQKRMSIRHLVPNQVIDYIMENGLYGTSKDGGADNPTKDAHPD